MTSIITAGSGLGSFITAARKEEFAKETFEATKASKTLYFKSFKPTWDPHPVQGGPYLAAGRIADIGSGHVLMGRDAKATLTGDLMTTSQALLLGNAFGCNPSLKQISTTTAYELAHTPPGGTAEAGLVLEASESHDAEKHSPFVDLLVGVPYTNAEVAGFEYWSGVIQKATFTFDRMNLVSYEYDLEFRTVKEAAAGKMEGTAPTFTTTGVPFAMNEGSSEFKIGKPGSATALQGVRKMVVTLEHKMATDRWYLGQEYKALPVSNGLVDVGISVEADYTEAAKNVFKAFLANEATEITARATGAEIGTSGHKNEFTITFPNLFINSGAEPPIDGPDLVKTTMATKATINAANEPVVKATLTTADTTV